MGKVILVLAILVVCVVLGAFITQWLWGYLMPNLFPEAVTQKYIAAHISWWVALVFNIALGLWFYQSNRE